jgi:hypothetical protein
VKLTAVSQNWTAAAALGFNLLRLSFDAIGQRAVLADCVTGAIHDLTGRASSAADTVGALQGCVNRVETRLSATKRAALKKIAAGLLTTDLFFKLVDAGADGAYGGRAEFAFRGLATTNRILRPTNTELGAISAGTTTVRQLGATGGRPPYAFRISRDAVNAGPPPGSHSPPTGG